MPLASTTLLLVPSGEHTAGAPGLHSLWGRTWPWRGARRLRPP